MLSLNRDSRQVLHDAVYKNLFKQQVEGILGPPGCGKTQLISVGSAELGLDRIPVYIVAYTNAEVVDLYQRILNQWLSTGTRLEDANSWIRVYGSTVHNAPFNVPRGTSQPIDSRVRVVISTEYQRRFVEHNFDPNVIFMDERSTRRIEHSGMALASVSWGGKEDRLVIVVGDPEQDISLEPGISTLHLLRRIKPLHVLRYTFRMPHPLHIPSAGSYYNWGYEPHPKINKTQLIPSSGFKGKYELVLGPEKIVLVDVKSNPEKYGNSWINPQLDHVVMEIATEATQRYQDAQIRVLSTHAPDANVLLDGLRNFTNLSVGTVHSSLGLEADITLVSVPKAYRSFLSWKDTIFNVAITRARQKLILLGHLYWLYQCHPQMGRGVRIRNALRLAARYGITFDQDGREQNFSD